MRKWTVAHGNMMIDAHLNIVEWNGNATSASLTFADYYPLSDPMHSATALTDGLGRVAMAFDIDAYGQTLVYGSPGKNHWFTDSDRLLYGLETVCQSSSSSSSSSGSEWPIPSSDDLRRPRLYSHLYTGQRYDPETRLYHCKARYYHPPLGRFVSRDSAGYEEGMNLYQHLVGKPVMRNAPESSWITPLPASPKGEGWKWKHGKRQGESRVCHGCPPWPPEFTALAARVDGAGDRRGGSGRCGGGKPW